MRRRRGRQTERRTTIEEVREEAVGSRMETNKSNEEGVRNGARAADVKLLLRQARSRSRLPRTCQQEGPSTPRGEEPLYN